MSKKLVSLSLLIAASVASVPAFADTGSVTKTATAQSINIFSNGTGTVGLTSFSLLSTDFPGLVNKTKTLTQVSYTIAAYPTAATDNVQLCYYRPFAASPSKCINVISGSSSTTTEFNSFTFSHGAMLQVRHTVTGTPGDIVKPSRQESATFQFSY